MINFIHKLRHLPEKYMMNSVWKILPFFRSSRIETRKKLCCASLMYSKCQHRNTVLSITFTDWSKIELTLLSTFSHQLAVDLSLVVFCIWIYTNLPSYRSYHE